MIWVYGILITLIILFLIIFISSLLADWYGKWFDKHYPRPIKKAPQILCGTVIEGLKYQTAGQMGDPWPCNHQATKFWEKGCDLFCYCGSCQAILPNDACPITKQEAQRILDVQSIMSS